MTMTVDYIRGVDAAARWLEANASGMHRLGVPDGGHVDAKRIRAALLGDSCPHEWGPGILIGTTSCQKCGVRQPKEDPC